MALLAWAALNVFWPQDWVIEPRLLAVVNLVPSALSLGLAVPALRRGSHAAV